MNDVAASIAKIQRAYAEAVLAQDVPAFMRLYDSKVRVFDAWGIWQYDGALAWEAAVEGWFKSLGAERVRVGFEETEVFGSAELACASATVTYAAEGPQGQALRVMHNRMSWSLRTTGHVLRIVHEHTSSPVTFDDMKAILERPAKA